MYSNKDQKLRKALIASLLAAGSLLFSSTSTAQSPSTNWTYATGAPILATPAIDSEGNLYFGSYDETFYSVAPDGSLRWSFSLASGKNNEYSYPLSSPALISNQVCFGVERLKRNGSEATGQFYCLDTATGDLAWDLNFDNGIWAAVYSDPAIGPDGTIYFGCYDTNFYAYNPDGTEKWRFTPDDQIYSDAVIGIDGAIYFGCDDGKLYCLNDDGSLRWSVMGGHGLTGSPAIGPNNIVYFGSTWDFGARTNNGSRSLFAVAPNGTVQWQFRTGGFVESSPAVGRDGSIYFGSNDGNLYALKPDGSLKWTYPTGGEVKSSPAILADGTILVGSADTLLHAVNPDGTPAWTFDTGGAVSSSPAVAPDGTIYFGSGDARLYSVTSSTPLAVSYWPAFRQNSANTGQASSLSAPIRLSLVPASEGVNLQWNSVAGQTYEIHSSPSVEPAVWSSVASNIVAASDTTQRSLPGTNATLEIFRVQIAP